MSLTFPHRGRTALAMGSACALLTLVGCSSGDSTSPATTSASPTATSVGPGGTRIVIENFTFSPAKLQVRPGTKVTVVNKDSAAHTVTATEDKVFDTGNIAGGATVTFTAPSTPGRYSFLCTLHPYMKGTLTVT
ncbi:cupredoxin domain-containing protein [Streptomyces sp. 11x1]|uniref:cupredoxin domain-containing protein n=1 Tax=Streptomyces sp. 11x1 TaxID=3038642 RepID=UPI00292D361C|nr:cupredoxin domain-containing protein [Streptomyces sp. 11x1]WNZ09665.1 cupredoxin domain-containing protein [Streptomyces sp. 11x1]